MRRCDPSRELLALPCRLDLAALVRLAFAAAHLADGPRLVCFYPADSSIDRGQTGDGLVQPLDVPVVRIYVCGFDSDLLPFSLRLVTATNNLTQCNQRLTMRCSEPARLSRPLLPASALPPPRSGRASRAVR